MSTQPNNYTFEQQIEDIIEQLDDLRIVEVMDALNLRWLCAGAAGEPEMRVPHRAEVRDYVRRELSQFARYYEGKDAGLSSGRCFLILKTDERLSVYFTPVIAEAMHANDELHLRVMTPQEIMANG